jgi:hypothetical protein
MRWNNRVRHQPRLEHGCPRRRRERGSRRTIWRDGNTAERAPPPSHHLHCRTFKCSVRPPTPKYNNCCPKCSHHLVPKFARGGEVPNSWYIRVPSMALQAPTKSKIVPTQCDYLHQDDLHFFYRFLPHASDQSPDCSTDRRFPVPTPSQCSVFCPAQVQMFASLMQIYSGPRD